MQLITQTWIDSSKDFSPAFIICNRILIKEVVLAI